jgi:hypothetical protein
MHSFACSPGELVTRIFLHIFDMQDLGIALGSGSTFFVVRNTPIVKEKTLLASMARLMDELRKNAAGSLPKTEIGGQELFVLEAQDQVPAWPSSGIGEDFR